jgi:agmatinase
VPDFYFGPTTTGIKKQFFQTLIYRTNYLTMNTFDPNGVGIPNGNFLALPYTPEESDIILIQVPWDVTTSYRAGTSAGPKAIIDASIQLDLYDFELAKAWENKIATLPADSEIIEMNDLFRAEAEEIIAFLAEGGSEEDEKILSKINRINQASENLNAKVFETAKTLIESGKTVGVIGGEHSVPYGLIKALAETHHSFGILHIDAHADLREAYEGFTFSHASIMYNSMKLHHIFKLVQVGIRDLCQDEVNQAEFDERIIMYNDFILTQKEFKGETWSAICHEIISHLPHKVYVSFDIDGLTPDNCPHTGTPVPGGLTYRQAIYLLKLLAESGRKIIGFDLSEVAPGPDDEWDANVGARVLRHLCNFTAISQK